MNANGYPLACVPDDGYTEDGYIDGVPGLHPPIRFVYRPASGPERRQLVYRITYQLADQPAQADAVSAAFLAAKIVSWDVMTVDPAAGRQLKLMPTSDAALLKPIVHEKLLAVLCGTRPSDPDPVAKGRPASQPDAEGDRKNLRPG